VITDVVIGCDPVSIFLGEARVFLHPESLL